MKTKSLIRKAAESVVRECLDGQPGGFSTRQVFDRVAEFATSYKSPNALGTALGEGVRGSGLGLHRDEAGNFRRCRDNAALAVAELSDAERAAAGGRASFCWNKRVDQRDRSVFHLPHPPRRSDACAVPANRPGPTRIWAGGPKDQPSGSDEPMSGNHRLSKVATTLVSPRNNDK